MSARPPALDPGLCQRYGALAQALAPRLRGLVLADQRLLRSAAWGSAPTAIDPLLLETGWTAGAPLPEAAVSRLLDAQQAVVLQPLVSASQRLLGAVALVVPAAEASDADELLLRLAPALDCLREELQSAELAAQQVEALLESPLLSGAAMEALTTLESLLDAGLAASGGQYAMLRVPSCGISVSRQAGMRLAPAVALEVAGLVARLDGLCGQLPQSLVIDPSQPTAAGGQVSHCRLRLIPLACCDGAVPGVLAYLSPLQAAEPSITQVLSLGLGAAAMARRLEAGFDRDTGLFNRLGLEQQLAREPLGHGSLVLLDLDRLQSVNELHGFEAGDRLIAQVAQLLRAPLVPTDACVARLFGGCFAVLLPWADASTAQALAQSLMDNVATLPLSPTQVGGLTASCGIAETRSLSTQLDRAFVSAELVLKLAKERGRGRAEVHVSEDSLIIRRHEEVFAAADLRAALRTGQMLLFGQKIVSLHEPDAPIGFELLLRMRGTDGTVHSAKEFIDAAQRYQLLPEIDRHVFDRAIELLTPHRLLVGRRRVGFSINVSGGSLCDPSFIEHVVAQVKRLRMPPKLITLEITEQVAVSDLTWAAQMMQRLREAGCGVALDDFGTGANSLAYLRVLPVTRIKIDGSFVRDLLTDPRSEAAVRGVTQLAQAFRLDTVAEFVEDAQQAEKLRQIGVERGQGHHYSKPAPLEGLLAELQDREDAELRELLAPG